MLLFYNLLTVCSVVKMINKQTSSFELFQEKVIRGETNELLSILHLQVLCDVTYFQTKWVLRPVKGTVHLSITNTYLPLPFQQSIVCVCVCFYYAKVDKWKWSNNLSFVSTVTSAPLEEKKRGINSWVSESQQERGSDTAVSSSSDCKQVKLPSVLWHL